ncbi:MAG: mevalonate kinase [Candidatus Micrarchaeia archaeon]|jgi:mevalonate kinase
MGFEGTGYGKAILIGEHFVVHGARGIGMGIPRKTTVILESAPSLSFSFECGDLLKEATRRVLGKVAGGTGFEVSVTSEFPVSAGMGWSASYCVALARAAAAAVGKEISDKEAAKAAFEGERAFHGNPSGIDNTLAAHGGVMLFKRGKEPESLKVGGKFHFVIANSGKKGPTKELVDKVSAMRTERPEEYGALEEAEEWLVGKAIGALAAGDAGALGDIMDKNNELLTRLGLSTPTIDNIRGTALGNGALGAKITGAGGGGCVLILAPDADRAAGIAGKLDKYEAFSFIID